MGMELDSFRNKLFSRNTVRGRLSAILLEFTKNTVHDQLSLSEYDYEEILASHKMARDLVDKYFEMMKESLEYRRANLVKYSGIKFISLGEDCFSRMVLTHWGLKPNAKLGEKSHPFDLAVHSVLAIIRLLETDFDGYLVTGNLQFHEEHKTVFNHKFGNIHFNHEIGGKYAENDYQLLIDIYQKRIANFFHDITTHDKLIFILHHRDNQPKFEMEVHLNKLWGLIKTKWPQKDMKLLCVNTWAYGEEIDLTNRGVLDDEAIKIIDIHYPYPNYVWHQPTDSLSEAGYSFEKGLIDQVTGIVDNWANPAGAMERLSPPTVSTFHSFYPNKNDISEENMKSGESLIVKKVQRAEGLSLVVFAVGFPKENQVVVDDNLIIAGWVVGKTSFADKVIVSGGINAEIPVDIHRPDIHLHFGERIENLCPQIDSVPRSGFHKKIPLDAIDVESPIEVTAVLQDGSKALLATITLAKDAAEPEQAAAPKAPEPADESQPQPKTTSYLSKTNKKQAKKRKKGR